MKYDGIDWERAPKWILSGQFPATGADNYANYAFLS